MARPHKPWYRKSRNAWFVEIRGKQHNLGPDEEQALRQYHELMAKMPEIEEDSLAEMLDSYVVFCFEEKAKRTAQWYEDYLQDFLDYLKIKGKKPGVMKPSSISPKEVRRWVNDRGTAKRARITSIKTAYKWGQREGWMKHNPMSEMERPPIKRREGEITEEDYKALLVAIKDENFKALIEFCWDVGCRPDEAKSLQRRHLDLDNHRCVFPKEESKGKKRPRVIYLTDKAEKIVEAQLEAHGEPTVFLNLRGKPWTANAVRCRFKRLEDKVGKLFCQYLIRSAWITRKLKSGVDSRVVAKLSGHSNTAMIDKHYSRIGDDAAFLLEQARKGESPADP